MICGDPDRKLADLLEQAGEAALASGRRMFGDILKFLGAQVAGGETPTLQAVLRETRSASHICDPNRFPEIFAIHTFPEAARARIEQELAGFVRFIKDVHAKMGGGPDEDSESVRQTFMREGRWRVQAVPLDLPVRSPKD